LASSTVNRTCAAFQAALELAATQDPRITNQSAWRTGLAALPDAEQSRNVILPEDAVLSIISAAYAVSREFGLLVEVAVVTGARISQLARLEVGDLQGDRSDPRLMMPSARKGRSRKRIERRPVPIPTNLAMVLKQAGAGRPSEAPLLTKPSGELWRHSDHRHPFERAVTRAGLDPAEVTIYALRHSSIVRQLLANTPIRVDCDPPRHVGRDDRADLFQVHHRSLRCPVPPCTARHHPTDRRECRRLEGADVRHGTGSTALITTASAEWVLLSVIYHYVLAQSPSPESAKITISTARRNGQLRLRAEVREREARPDLTLSPGEQPPEIQPKRKPDQPILASDKFSTWDWERSYALRRDATTKSLFEYMDLVGNRDDVLKLWPPAETTVTTETLKTAKTAVAKPVDVSRLVWAVVLTLDEIEKQTPTGLAGFTQKHLTEMVSTRLRRVSQRTLQKAVAVSRKRNGRH